MKTILKFVKNDTKKIITIIGLSKDIHSCLFSLSTIDINQIEGFGLQIYQLVYQTVRNQNYMQSIQFQKLKETISEYIQNVFKKMSASFLCLIDQKIMTMNTLMENIQVIGVYKIKEYNSIMHSIKKMQNILNQMEFDVSQTKSIYINSIKKFSSLIKPTQSGIPDKKTKNVRSFLREYKSPTNTSLFSQAIKNRNKLIQNESDSSKYRHKCHSKNISHGAQNYPKIKTQRSEKPDKSILNFKKSLIQTKNWAHPQNSNKHCRQNLKQKSIGKQNHSFTSR